jgi:DNA polymerase-3 subunit delta
MLRSGGLFARERFVLCRELIGELDTSYAEACRDLGSDTIVVFEDALSVKNVETSDFFKAFAGAKDVYAYPFKAMAEPARRSWARKIITDRNGSIEESALAFLLERVGDDTWRLHAEVQKLAGYKGASPITRTDVELLVQKTFDDRIFDFVDALSTPNGTAARLLSHERSAGAADGELFAMCIRQIRLLLCARDLLDRRAGTTPSDIARELAIHPFVAGKVFRQAKCFTRKHLAFLHDMAFALDRETKQGRKELGLALEELLVAFSEPSLSQAREARLPSAT